MEKRTGSNGKKKEENKKGESHLGGGKRGRDKGTEATKKGGGGKKKEHRGRDKGSVKKKIKWRRKGSAFVLQGKQIIGYAKREK